MEGNVALRPGVAGRLKQRLQPGHGHHGDTIGFQPVVEQLQPPSLVSAAAAGRGQLGRLGQLGQPLALDRTARVVSHQAIDFCRHPGQAVLQQSLLLFEIFLAQTLFRQDPGQQALQLIVDHSQATHFQTDFLQPEVDRGQFRAGQLHAHRCQLPVQTLRLTFAAREFVVGQTDRFAGAPLHVEQSRLLGLQRALRQSQGLQTLTCRILLVAQQIDAQRGIRRRAGEVGRQRRLGRALGLRLLQLFQFVENLQAIAIGDDQTTEEALTIAGRHTISLWTGTTFQESFFLLATGLGELCLGLRAHLVGGGSGRCGHRGFRLDPAGQLFGE
jgi:hypothetical protein